MAGDVLLDTNILILSSRDADAFQSALSGFRWVCTSAVAIGELHYGARKSAQVERNLKQIELLIRTIEVLPCDTETARVFGDIKAELHRKGTPIPDNDVWIAAAARQHGCAVATRDQHFHLIDALEIVQV